MRSKNSQNNREFDPCWISRSTDRSIFEQTAQLLSDPERNKRDHFSRTEDYAMKTFQSPASVSTADANRRLERSKIYRFDVFELSTMPLRLSRAGEPITLQPQPARALKLLIENRGQIVTREMLREYLWGKGTFLDHEQGINFALRKIRIALGDSPSAPSFIETVPRLGYRFVAEVDEMPRSSSDSRPSARPADRMSRPHRSGLLGRRPMASSACSRGRKALGRRCRSWT